MFSIIAAIASGFLKLYPQHGFHYCQALHSIGDLIANHPKNLEELASKRLGEEPDLEPALNSVLRILLRTSSKQEFMAADYLFKNFCQVGILTGFLLN